MSLQRKTRTRADAAVLCVALCAAIVVMLVVGASPAPAAFPGANGKIAFTSDGDGNGDVFVMNADGSGRTNLTNNPAYDIDPAWSPAGNKIAFTSGRDGSLEIYVMNADGSGQSNLTSNAAIDVEPAWSPAGNKIAF